MKKILFILFIVALFSCEKEPECWMCDEITRLELSNKAYSFDTVIVNIQKFIVCEYDNMVSAKASREDKEDIEYMELQGTVFYWTGTKYIEVECKLIK